ncbi:MAG: hypothetical protein EA367_07990 [Leptolyngbya sp. DLM2.Bin15]|nr:MAG: hypothetical protein EA367_07990 [Leptolyngbya sp. DLM2.Bin15]
MKQQSFEGTWEEILRYAPELAGQRVKLTVLSNESTPLQNETTLDQVLQGRVGRVQFQPSNLSTRTKQVFTDLLKG